MLKQYCDVINLIRRYGEKFDYLKKDIYKRKHYQTSEEIQKDVEEMAIMLKELNSNKKELENSVRASYLKENKSFEDIFNASLLHFLTVANQIHLELMATINNYPLKPTKELQRYLSILCYIPTNVFDQFLEEVKKANETKDASRLDLVSSFMEEILEENFVKKVIDDKLSCIQHMTHEYRRLNQNDDVLPGQIFKLAAQKLEELFNLEKQKNLSRIFKLYELFNLSVEQTDTIDDSFFKKEYHKDAGFLSDELINLIPKEIILMPTNCSVGLTLQTGEIAINNEIFNLEDSSDMTADECPMNVAMLMLTLLHELAHLKKYQHQARWNSKFETPFKIKSLNKNNDTTGGFFEKQVFGNKCDVFQMSEEIAQMILDVNNWDEDTLQRIGSQLCQMENEGGDYDEEEKLEDSGNIENTEKHQKNKECERKATPQSRGTKSKRNEVSFIRKCNTSRRFELLKKVSQ